MFVLTACFRVHQHTTVLARITAQVQYSATDASTSSTISDIMGSNTAAALPACSPSAAEGIRHRPLRVIQVPSEVADESLIEVNGQEHRGASSLMVVDGEHFIAIHSPTSVRVVTPGPGPAAAILPPHQCPGINLSTSTGAFFLPSFESNGHAYEGFDMSKRIIGTHSAEIRIQLMSLFQ